MQKYRYPVCLKVLSRPGRRTYLRATVEATALVFSKGTKNQSSCLNLSLQILNILLLFLFLSSSFLVFDTAIKVQHQSTRFFFLPKHFLQDSFCISLYVWFLLCFPQFLKKSNGLNENYSFSIEMCPLSTSWEKQNYQKATAMTSLFALAMIIS